MKPTARTWGLGAEALRNCMLERVRRALACCGCQRRLTESQWQPAGEQVAWWRLRAWPGSHPGVASERLYTLVSQCHRRGTAEAPPEPRARHPASWLPYIHTVSQCTGMPGATCLQAITRALVAALAAHPYYPHSRRRRRRRCLYRRRCHPSLAADAPARRSAAAWARSTWEIGVCVWSCIMWGATDHLAGLCL